MVIKICSLKEIASWEKSDIGFTEEDVKVKVIVPLLLSLGHKITQLYFEYSDIDIFLKDLPVGCTVIVETKNILERDLDKYFPQLEKYAKQTNALFAILTNGEEIRIYAPPYGSPLYTLHRRELADPTKYEILRKFLSRSNLVTKKSVAYLYEEITNVIGLLGQRYDDLTEIYQDVMEWLKSERENGKLKKILLRAKKIGVLHSMNIEELVIGELDKTNRQLESLSKLINKLEKLLEDS